jgi:hypothetical protein
MGFANISFRHKPSPFSVRKKSRPYAAANAATLVLFYHGNAGAEEISSFDDILILNMIQVNTS